MRVYLFDDLLYQTRHTLRIPGLQILCFADADQAAQIVVSDPPDLVLMDYELHAEKTGVDAVLALVALRRTQGLSFRIVAISSSLASNEDMIAAGADDAIPKTHVRAYLHRVTV